MYITAQQCSKTLLEYMCFFHSLDLGLFCLRFEGLFAFIFQVTQEQTLLSHTQTHTGSRLTSAGVDVSARRGETSGPAGVDSCHSELVPATWPGVGQPSSLLRGL